MPGSIYEALFELGADNYGFVTQAQARELGIPAQRLVVLEDRGLLERRRQQQKERRLDERDRGPAQHLARDDLRKLHAVLHELAECRKLIEAVAARAG